MKLIVEIYLNKRKVDAWQLDTKNLTGNPKIIRVHVASQTTVQKSG